MTFRIRSGARYDDETFEEVRLQGAGLEGSRFCDCVFVRCSFAESILRRCRFHDCLFRQCDLSLVKLPECIFSATRFMDSKVIGVDWTLLDWDAPRLGNLVAFERCTLSYATFLGLDLPGIRIVDCMAREVDFREANLSRTDFEGTDLTGSLFSATNLEEADLSSARNYHIDPGRNILTRTRFSMPEAMALLHAMDIVLTDGEE